MKSTLIILFICVIYFLTKILATVVLQETKISKLKLLAQ